MAQCGEHNFLLFRKSKMLHYKLTIDKMPHVHKQVCAQAHTHFTYNTTLLVPSGLGAGKGNYSVCCSIHNIILQTQSSLNLPGLSNAYFVISGIFQRKVQKRMNRAIFGQY